jgi:hypothetical protein
VLLGLLNYGNASGVFRSRKIKRATYDSVAVRYVAADTYPDHYSKRRAGIHALVAALEIGMCCRCKVGRLKLVREVVAQPLQGLAAVTQTPRGLP